MTDILSFDVRDDRRLAVDLGGSTLRMVECDLDGVNLTHEKFVHPQDRFGSLDEALTWFIEKLGYRPLLGTIGAAGPISRGRSVKLTNNADWPVFDADIAEKVLGCRLFLVNDLVIAAASIPALKPNDLDVIKSGVAELDAPRLVATLSTGVNDALALPQLLGQTTADPLGFLPAEAGWSPFAPRSEIELDLLRWVWQQGQSYVGFEPIISATNGSRLVFELVTATQGIAALPETLAALAAGEAAGPIITKAALDGNDPAALMALQIIGGAIGSYLGSRVVATLAKGGVFLVGSVSQNKRLMQYFHDNSPFLERFSTAGPYDSLVENVPISRILHPEIDLLGACEIARNLR